MPNAIVLAIWMLATLVLSASFTALAIRYARRRQMFDMPGQRRSHQQPTPRGGGIGIVVAILVGIMLPLAILPVSGPTTPVIALAGLALLIVASAGWIDDHGGLRARYRFAAHCLAAALLLAAMWPELMTQMRADHALTASNVTGLVVLVGILVLAIAWSINLHNFMDGINGILASQAIFVLASLGAIGMTIGSAASWPVSLLAAAAVAGFLPFNFPKARVFMGDVGSGAVGLLVAVALLYQLGDPSLDAATGLIACSAFSTDATVTLLSRMLRGRRWYDAHREHLYQGLVRSGYSHATVVGFYLGWNVFVALPAMLLIQPSWSTMIVDPSPLNVSLHGTVALVAVHALAVIAWWLGQRHCRQRVRARGKHGVA